MNKKVWLIATGIGLLLLVLSFGYAAIGLRIVGWLGLLFFAALLGAAYCLPSIVALKRPTSLQLPAIVINLFLGWTFVGWVVALALAVGGKTPQEKQWEQWQAWQQWQARQPHW